MSATDFCPVKCVTEVLSFVGMGETPSEAVKEATERANSHANTEYQYSAAVSTNLLYNTELGRYVYTMTIVRTIAV